MENLTSMLAYRSRTLDEILQNSAKDKKAKGNVFYENPEFRQELQKGAGTLQKMFSSTKGIGELFGAMEKDIKHLKKLEDLNGSFEDIEDLVLMLDNLLKVEELHEALDEINEVSYRFSKINMDKVSNRVS